MTHEDVQDAAYCTAKEALERAHREGGDWVRAESQLGIVIALLAIDLTLLRGVHALEKIAKSLEPRHAVRLGLRTTITDKEGNPMPPITPITIDPAVNDLLFETARADQNGNPLPVPLTWASDGPTNIALEVAADGLSAKGRTQADPSGAITVTVSCTDGALVDSQAVTLQAAPPPPPAVTLGLKSTPISKGA